MRITRIGVVDDRLAAFLTGVELLQIPTSVLAEFAVETFDHLSAHRGGPVVFPPPRQSVKRQQTLAERMQIPLGPFTRRALDWD